ncbi:MAG: hydroxymethyltransferase, partial [Pseudomonadota bacterium]
PPKHAYAFGDVGRLHRQIRKERVAALGQFHHEVRAQNFPYPETNIAMRNGEHARFLEALDAWTPTHT